MRLGIRFEGAQYKCGKLLGAECALADLKLSIGPHVTLEIRDGERGIADEPIARRLADDNFARFQYADDGRRQHIAQRVWNQFCSTVAPDADKAICSAEVDSDEHADMSQLPRHRR